MYDILQLNDMLVPELLDIADQLKIIGAKKLDKQALIYKILDRQAVDASSKTNNDTTQKRKKIIKTSTSLITEEAEVEESDDDKKTIKKSTMPPKKDEKSTVKKPRKKAEEKEPVSTAAEKLDQIEKAEEVESTGVGSLAEEMLSATETPAAE